MATKKVTKKQSKKIITVMVNDVSTWELEGKLSDVSALIQEWIKKYGADARLNWDPDYWPQYNDSPSPRYEIKIDREETDAEYEKRIEAENFSKNLHEAREREEFERLQKKFGAKK
jgi:hypothetical protein